MKALLEAGAKFLDDDAEWWSKLIAEFGLQTVCAECRSLKGSSTTARARVIEKRLRGKVAALEKDQEEDADANRQAAEAKERRAAKERHLAKKPRCDAERLKAADLAPQLIAQAAGLEQSMPSLEARCLALLKRGHHSIHAVHVVQRWLALHAADITDALLLRRDSTLVDAEQGGLDVSADGLVDYFTADGDPALCESIRRLATLYSAADLTNAIREAERSRRLCGEEGRPSAREVGQLLVDALDRKERA